MYDSAEIARLDLSQYHLHMRTHQQIPLSVYSEMYPFLMSYFHRGVLAISTKSGGHGCSEKGLPNPIIFQIGIRELL